MASEALQKLWCLVNSYTIQGLVPRGELLSVTFARYIVNKNNIVVATPEQIEDLITNKPQIGGRSDTLSADGSETLSPPSQYRIFTYKVYLTAGVGAYTWTITMSGSGRLPWDKICIVFLIADTVNPTLNVNNIESTLLFHLTGTGTKISYQAWFTYDGADWTLDE